MNRSTRYEGESGRAYHEGKSAIPEEAFGWVAESRALKFQRYIGPRDAVFEYGVGYGWNLAGLNCGRKAGFDVALFLAVEVEKRGIEFLNETETLPGGLRRRDHLPSHSGTCAQPIGDAVRAAAIG